MGALHLAREPGAFSVQHGVNSVSCTIPKKPKITNLCMGALVKWIVRYQRKNYK